MNAPGLILCELHSSRHFAFQCWLSAETVLPGYSAYLVPGNFPSQLQVGRRNQIYACVQAKNPVTTCSYWHTLY